MRSDKSVTSETSISDEGFSAKGIRIALVISRYHSELVEHLVEGALQCFLGAKGEAANLEYLYVPGSFEIPLMAQEAAKYGRVDAVVAVGAVIRGETNHYDLICNEITRALMEISLRTAVPITFGIVTADNMQQARARAGGEVGNKGHEAMQAALQMLAGLRVLKERRL